MTIHGCQSALARSEQSVSVRSSRRGRAAPSWQSSVVSPSRSLPRHSGPCGPQAPRRAQIRQTSRSHTADMGRDNPACPLSSKRRERRRRSRNVHCSRASRGSHRPAAGAPARCEARGQVDLSRWASTQACSSLASNQAKTHSPGFVGEGSQLGVPQVGTPNRQRGLYHAAANSASRIPTDRVFCHPAGAEDLTTIVKRCVPER